MLAVMGNTTKTCLICARPEGRAIVDALLLQKVTMKKIALETGFSKSGIGRHSLKCLVRQRAAKLKAGRYDATKQRLIVKDLDGRLRLQRDPHGTIPNPARFGLPVVLVAMTFATMTSF